MIHIATFLLTHHHHCNNSIFCAPSDNKHYFNSTAGSKSTGYGAGVALVIFIIIFILYKMGLIRND